MIQRYFLIEPNYSDPDTLCCFTVGSGRVRASIQIYADISMLLEVVSALEAKSCASMRLFLNLLYSDQVHPEEESHSADWKL